MILLDTSAIIWIEQRHARVRPLMRGGRTLFVSPATLLELQFLLEAGRIRMAAGAIEELAHDERWVIDEPAAAAWFLRAAELAWTRDPFDRLLAAHAQLRGFRLATADRTLLERLGPSNSVEL